MKYKDIADRIIQDIQSEKLESGQRMPSLRQLTKQLGVSMTTALNSYRALEELGWLVSYPKSGFYVSTFSSNENQPELPQFKSRKAPVSISNKADNYDDRSHTSGPLGVSQVCPDNIPLTEINAHIRQTVQRGDALLHTYPNPQGSTRFRDALATHFSKNGFPLGAKELCISSGCMDAIRMAVLATTQVGDAVGISSPCFNGLLKLLASMSRKVVEIPCTSEGLDLDQIEQRLKNKEINAGLFSSSFMNPHGISLSIEQKQRLASLANKYRTPIIEDDVYGELGHENLYPLPVKHWDTNGYVIWCSSISKTLSSGLRIGWCAPGRYLDKCIDICASERLGHNELIQLSIASLINAGQYQSHIQRIRKTSLSNANAYRTLLLENLPEGSAVSAPKGGLVLWVQTPNLDPERFRQLIKDADIDIRFGPQFTTKKLYKDCFRLNFGWSLSNHYDSNRTIEDALLQITQIVKAARV